jgi:hypothetical protein
VDERNSAGVVVELLESALSQVLAGGSGEEENVDA